MIKTTPMLFNDAMVRALLDGRKTQTRRIVKPPRQWPENSRPDPFAMPPAVWWWNGKHHRVGVRQECPYGSVGDLIYVREAWCQAWDGDRNGWYDPPRAHYRASTPDVVHIDDAERSPWRPSIHMPRRFSRLTLRITDVRVQRLQEISEADAIAEGCPAVSLWDLDAESTPPSHHFRALWGSINGAGSWEQNPWVWAISFDVIRANVDDVLREQAA